METEQYDTWMLRELLNNCIAHSYYQSGERIYVNEGSTRRDYLQLPVLARFNWKIGDDIKMHVAVGPYLAYGIGGKYKSKFLEVSEKGTWHVDESVNPFKNSSLQRFDWGVALNVGVEVKRFSFNVAYDMGLGKQYEYENVALNYHTVSFTVGYRF